MNNQLAYDLYNLARRPSKTLSNFMSQLKSDDVYEENNEPKPPKVKDIMPEFNMDDYHIMEANISGTRLGNILDKYNISPAETGPWICGSAALSTLCEIKGVNSVPFNDIDFFFPDEELMDDFEQYFEEEMESFCEQVIADTVKVFYINECSVQFIHPKLFHGLLNDRPTSYKYSSEPTAQHILSTFDLRCSQVAYFDGHFIYEKNVLEDIVNMELVFNLHNFKASSLGRIHKYNNKGFTVYDNVQWANLTAMCYKYGPLDKWNYEG